MVRIKGLSFVKGASRISDNVLLISINMVITSKNQDSINKDRIHIIKNIGVNLTNG